VRCLSHTHTHASTHRHSARKTLTHQPSAPRANTRPQSTKIFVNGVWIGIHREPQTLVRTLRHLRRRVDINTEVRAAGWCVCVCMCQRVRPTQPHTHAHAGAHAHADAHARTHMRTRTHTRVHTHAHTHVHTRTRTHARARQVGVIYDIPLKELRLFTDYGRASRPIFVVDDQRLLIKKEDIIKLQVRARMGACPAHGRTCLNSAHVFGFDGVGWNDQGALRLH